MGAIRTWLLVLVMLGSLGLGAELLLLDHFESPLQWIPLVSLTLGLGATSAVIARPGRTAVRAFVAIMTLFIAAGLLGLYLHYRGNTMFELEMDASTGGLALFWRAMRGATPALAPGALIQLGMIGLIAAFRHPALRHDARHRSRRGGI
ncbi:MAG: hypothetical protein ACRELV_06345 [Longimicrobiales bacterium]